MGTRTDRVQPHCIPFDRVGTAYTEELKNTRKKKESWPTALFREPPWPPCGECGAGPARLAPQESHEETKRSSP